MKGRKPVFLLTPFKDGCNGHAETYRHGRFAGTGNPEFDELGGVKILKFLIMYSNYER